MKIALEVISKKMGVSIEPCQIVRFESDVTRDRVFRAKKG